MADTPSPKQSRAFVLFGVAGSGKTTVGTALCDHLNAVTDLTRDAVFVDADDLHDAEAIEKMSKGVALTEEDRDPWLQRARARVAELANPDGPCGSNVSRHRDIILACSALKPKHRAFLVEDAEEAIWLKSIHFAHLKVSHATLKKRLETRTNTGTHFYPPQLLQSQLDTLKLTGSEIEIDAEGSVQSVVDACVKTMNSFATENENIKKGDLSVASLLRFMDAWYERVAELGLGGEVDSDTVVIDHACFRCSTAEQYESVIDDLQQMGHEVEGASVIGGREISTIKLNPPVTWRKKEIQAIEVPMPKPGRPKPGGWEHAEVALMVGEVVGSGELETFVGKYNNLPWDVKGLAKTINCEVSLDLGNMSVKFHNRPLLEVVEFEIANGTARVPSKHGEGRKRKQTETDTKGVGVIVSEEDTPSLDALNAFADESKLFGLEVREPWSSLILNGTKTVETRAYALPVGLMGKPLVLLSVPELKKGEAVKSGIPDEAPFGAAKVVGLVTFDEVDRFETINQWKYDREKHAVPGESSFNWDGQSPLFGWRVSEALAFGDKKQSPPMTRKYRSVFQIHADVETLLGEQDESEDDDQGRWGDEGAFDRPWH